LESAGGKLGGLLEVRNQVLPSLIGDPHQQGSLNQLAQTLADQVNQLLTSGLVSENPAQPGTALFSYDAANPTTIAASSAVSSAITADQLAALDPGPPYSSNGIAIRLAELGSEGKIEGVGLVAFYGEIAARIGREVNAANEDSDLQAQLVAQAKTIRQEASGVSLDEEAVMLIQFQRAYQAAARMISILDELTETAVNLAS
jgi:flagellar hook-associated protein 1 FlgK